MARRNQSAAQHKAKPTKLPPSRGSALQITHPNAAGIGANSHFVTVPADRDDEPAREFRAFTADLQTLVDWLRASRVDTVVMESTGVYWIPLFELLSSRVRHFQAIFRHEGTPRSYESSTCNRSGV